MQAGREGGVAMLKDILTSCVHSPSQHTHTRSHLTPSWRASDTPIMLIASSMLLHILAACPAPLSPQCITALPIHSRRGVARSHDSLDPPTMNVSTPLVAAPTPVAEKKENKSLRKRKGLQLCANSTQPYREQIFIEHETFDYFYEVNTMS